LISGRLRSRHMSTLTRPTSATSTNRPVDHQAWCMHIQRLAKDGDLYNMLRYAQAMTTARLRPDLETVNAVIGAFAAVDDRKNVFKYYRAMRELRLEPNSTTFDTLIGMWATRANLPNLVRWIGHMRRQQCLPTAQTVRHLKQAFQLKARTVEPMLYVKHAKLAKRYLQLTPDLLAEAKKCKATLKDDGVSARMRWVVEKVKAQLEQGPPDSSPNNVPLHVTRFVKSKTPRTATTTATIIPRKAPSKSHIAPAKLQKRQRGPIPRHERPPLYHPPQEQKA